MKRHLNEQNYAAVNAHPIANAILINRPKRMAKILPLEESPALLAFTPRSFANGIAEINDLRSRVQGLELKLAIQEQNMENVLAHTTPTKRLPPLTTHSSSSPILPTTHQRHYSVPGGVLLQGIDFSLKIDNKWLVSGKLGETNITTTETKCGNRLAPSRRLKSKNLKGLINPDDQLAAPPENGKMVLDKHGATSFCISNRAQLYQTLNRICALVGVNEDDAVLMKKHLDSEMYDVVKFLLSVENDTCIESINQKLQALLKYGSPSMQHIKRMQVATLHPIWGIQYPLRKVARNLQQLRISSNPLIANKTKPDVIVLVSNGAYNPLHMLHIRAFYVARQHLEANYTYPVVGAFISPSHDTYVRQKNRQKPHEMLPKRHRLAIAEAAIAASSWIEVDKWEITRRRVLDYLSTLCHVREMCESHFSDFKFHIIYVCGCNTVVKLNSAALREDGFRCITVCRPSQTDMTLKHLGKHLAKVATVVEDPGVLPLELERTTSSRIRKSLLISNLAQNSSQINDLEVMVGKDVAKYLQQHQIGLKMQRKEPWTDEDRSWRPEDMDYVTYIEC